LALVHGCGRLPGDRPAVRSAIPPGRAAAGVRAV
jgi:hypothetical protein